MEKRARRVVGELGNPSGFTRLTTGSLLPNRPDSHLGLLQDIFTERGLFYPSPFLSGNHFCIVKRGRIRPVLVSGTPKTNIIIMSLIDAVNTITYTHVKYKVWGRIQGWPPKTTGPNTKRIVRTYHLPPSHTFVHWGRFVCLTPFGKGLFSHSL